MHCNQQGKKMFTSISWQQYLIVVTSFTGIYYLAVIAIYYRKEVLFYFTGGSFKSRALSGAVQKRIVPAEAKASVLFDTVHQLMSDLNALLREAASHQYPKEQLLMALEVCLRNYNTIRGTKFQDVINEHIQTESEISCQLQLEDAELAQLW